MSRDPGHDRAQGGRPAKISRAKVIKAALDCTQATSLDSLTLRAVATKVGVSPMALYRHIRDRDDLVARVIDEVLGMVQLDPEPQNNADRSQWLLSMADSLHVALVAHSGVAEHVMALGPTGPQGFRLMDKICGVLLSAGLTPIEASEAYTLLMVSASGFCARSARLRSVAESLGVEPKETKSLFINNMATHAADLPSLAIVGPVFSSDREATYTLAISAILSTFMPPPQESP